MTSASAPSPTTAVASAASDTRAPFAQPWAVLKSTAAASTVAPRLAAAVAWVQEASSQASRATVVTTSAAAAARSSNERAGLFDGASGSMLYLGVTERRSVTAISSYGFRCGCQ